MKPCKVNRSKSPVGTFSVFGGWIAICDPCYLIDSTCAPALGVCIDVKAGAWHSEVIRSESGQIVALAAYKAGTHPTSKGAKFETIGTAMVDSGQMSIMGQSAGGIDEQIYSHICDDTCAAAGFGTHWRHGTWSGTGGDGIYPVSVRKNKAGQIIGVEVWFDSALGFEAYESRSPGKGAHLHIVK